MTSPATGPGLREQGEREARTIDDYAGIVGDETIEELRLLARPLAGLTVKMVNSTRVGGGVAEMLARVVPLLESLGISIAWDVIEGNGAFFEVTKQFHNAIHGGAYTLGEDGFATFLECNRRNAEALSFHEDIVVIHDPQPLALVAKRRPGQRWVWRCHIDSSNPDPEVWRFLEPWVGRYDAAIFSAPQFAQGLDLPQYLFYPSIDPLTEKNREMTPDEIDAVLRRLEIPRDVPIVTQVSRFDRLKDPVGVIRAFRAARKYVRCRLVLAGGGADDDPEGKEVLAEVREAAADDPEIHVVVLPPDAHLTINALQRASTVVVQKSLREGFGLTVSEALWKGKPVIGSAVGGIPVQIIHGVTGKLVHSVDGCAYQIRRLLSDPVQAERLGCYGRERVKEEFLITRNLRRWLVLFHLLGRGGDVIEIATTAGRPSGPGQEVPSK